MAAIRPASCNLIMPIYHVRGRYCQAMPLSEKKAGEMQRIATPTAGGNLKIFTRTKTVFGATVLAATFIGSFAFSETGIPYNLSFQGVPGLIEMPSAISAPDGELSTNVSTFAGITRNTLSFQITDRLGGSFRYSATQNWPNDGFNTYYDRGFDLRYRVLDETRIRPVVTIGLQDFVGTCLNSAEYIVASKSFGDKLRVTGGLGWGRLGSYNSFANPFGLDIRPTDFDPTGGTLNTDRWFLGPTAAFGGIEWQATDRLR
ncbi:MAG: YjbH domain-containing protein, partial [Halocynthiibacter sp.]